VDGRVVFSDVVPRASLNTARSNWWLLCAAVDVGWSHDSHQFCIRVLPPEEGQVMPETCGDIEHQQSVVKVKNASSLLLRNYVTMMHGQQNIKTKRSTGHLDVRSLNEHNMTILFFGPCIFNNVDK
jgi:hypothetical protein